MSRMMKDLSVKEPWSGPGPDPRKDKWADDAAPPQGEEDDDDEDSGEDIDRSTSVQCLPATLYAYIY